MKKHNPGRSPLLAAALALCCLSSAGQALADEPPIRSAVSPIYLHVDETPMQLMTMSAADRRLLADHWAHHMRIKSENYPDRVVAVRLRAATFAFDDLPRNTRIALRDAMPGDGPYTMREAREHYEGNISELIQLALEQVGASDAPGRFGAAGLPVESVNGSRAEGAATNARYAAAIELFDVFVSARSFILYGSNATEWDTIRHGLQEALRLRNEDQEVMYRVNDLWRIAFGEGGPNDVYMPPNDSGPSSGPTRYDFVDAGRMREGGSDETLSRGPGDDPPTDPGPRDYAFHWSVTGEYADTIDTTAFPIEHDTVIFYAHMLGAVPRIVNDEVFYGGVPQLGDIDYHLERIDQHLDEHIPDQSWGGYAVIDYEAWAPYWEGCSEEVKEIARADVRREHPGWSRNMIEQEAKERTETAAREWLLATIRRCKQLRPDAQWGYFLYRPYFSQDAPPLSTFDWLWEETQAFYPSVYASRYTVEGTPRNQWQARYPAYDAKFVERVYRLREHVGPERPILAYITWRYIDWNQRYGGDPMNDLDLHTALSAVTRMDADGVILWEWARTQEIRDGLQAYLDDVMGPRLIDFLNSRE